jgi:hypothetical protein
MLGIIFLVLLVVGFYAFIGLGAEAVVQMVLALFWVIMIASIPASLIYQAFR